MNIIKLSASKVAIITGDNRYESLQDYLITLWKRFNYNNYIITKNTFDNERRKVNQNIIIKEKLEIKLREHNIKLDIKSSSKKEINEKVNKLNLDKKSKEELKDKIKLLNNVDMTKSEAKKDVIKVETDREKTQRITKKLNLNIVKDLHVKSNNTIELKNNTDNIFEKINKTNGTKKEKEELKKSVQSINNKRYGTHREKFSIKHYKKLYNKNVIIDKSLYKRFIYQLENYTFILVGEIDGLLEDNIIIEIKNRARRLFKRLYNYEKVQMYMYMYLLNKSEGILVEHLNNQINNIHINYEEEYMNMILNKLVKFSNFYINLMNNVELQRGVLLGSKKEFNLLYSNYF